MSGFLHHFARRSLGLAPQVRSRAALPYAPPAAEPAMSETVGDPLHSPATPAERPARKPQTTGQSRLPSAASPLPTPLAAETDMETETAPTAHRDGNHQAPPATPQHRLADRPSPADARPAIAPPSEPADRAIVTPLAAETRFAMPRFADSRPTSNAIASPPADNPPAALSDIDSLVARLLGAPQYKPGIAPDPALPAPVIAPLRPGHRPPDIATVRPLAGRESPPLAADPADAPDVHITIGRLEVNPPSRPAPPAPPRPRGPAPLSLSDYLARRNGGRP